MFDAKGKQKTKAKPTNWFQIHPQDWGGSTGKPTGHYGRPEEHVKFLAEFAKGEDQTVWLAQPDERIPDAEIFPFEMLDKETRDYTTSSFAYQLQLLIWQMEQPEGIKVSDLYVYGINLTAMDEYAHQKPCVEYWLGRLEQAGVKLHIPAASSLLKGPKYARGTGEDELMVHARDRMEHHRNEYFQEWSNLIVGSSMSLETQFWAMTFNQMAEQFPEVVENEKLKNFIQERLDKRMKNNNGLIERSRDGASRASGMVVDNQHWLGIMGGHDPRANKLPDIRFPNPSMAGDWELPEPRAI